MTELLEHFIFNFLPNYEDDWKSNWYQIQLLVECHIKCHVRNLLRIKYICIKDIYKLVTHYIPSELPVNHGASWKLKDVLPRSRVETDMVTWMTNFNVFPIFLREQQRLNIHFDKYRTSLSYFIYPNSHFNVNGTTIVDYPCTSIDLFPQEAVSKRLSNKQWKLKHAR